MKPNNNSNDNDNEKKAAEMKTINSNFNYNFGNYNVFQVLAHTNTHIHTRYHDLLTPRYTEGVVHTF